MSELILSCSISLVADNYLGREILRVQMLDHNQHWPYFAIDVKVVVPWMMMMEISLFEAGY
jgi:hypothetical protein